LNVCRNWDNRCHAERKWSYEIEACSITKAQQERTGIRYRKRFPQAPVVFSQTLQTVCDAVDKAFQACFRRMKAGEVPGYPGFKGRHHFHWFAFQPLGGGARLDGRRLKL
jgi:putative transposase